MPEPARDLIATHRFTVQQLEQRWKECGYEVRWSGGEGGRRVELESPWHRGDYTAGGGATDLAAMGDATSWEWRRLAPELRALFQQGFEVEGEGR